MIKILFLSSNSYFLYKTQIKSQLITPGVKEYNFEKNLKSTQFLL